MIRNNLLFVSLLTLIGLPAFGAPITFMFSSTVDASGLGLSSSAALQIQYAYDPSLAPNPGSNAVYPIDFTVTIAGFVLLGHGTLGVGIQPSFQQVELNAATFVVGDTLTGNINGVTYSSVDLSIIDDVPPLDMLNSTALPTSTAFITRANFIRFEASDGNSGSPAHILKQFGPTDFTFVATPEPATGASLLFGALGLAALRYRQRAKPQIKAAH